MTPRRAAQEVLSGRDNNCNTNSYNLLFPLREGKLGLSRERGHLPRPFPLDGRVDRPDCPFLQTEQFSQGGKAAHRGSCG